MFKIIIVHGGLGNQMFAYAFAYTLKKKYPFSYVSLDMLETWQIHNGYELLKVFPEIKGKSFKFYRRQWKIYSQFFTKHFFYLQKEEEVDYCSYNNKYIEKSSLFQLYDGYWQSEKYFKKEEKLIRSFFSFDIRKLNQMSLSLFYKLEQDNNSVSVHIRRGDYQKFQHYFGGICTLDYYRKAIEYMQQNNSSATFYFFSDDINWARQEFNDLKVTFIDWNLKQDSWQDMFLMSKCKCNIIANSSFSWWGAWLNDNPTKIVIAPKKWFINIKALDIIPEKWIKM
jgi:hypothetical protein